MRQIQGKVRLFITTFVSSCLFGVLAASAHAAEPNLSLDLTQPGFDLVADAAKTYILDGLQNATLPDQSISIPLLAVAKAEGISYSVKIRKFALAPANGSLVIGAVIDSVHIDIDHIRFQNWLIPAIGTSCTSTSIDIDGAQMPLLARLNARVGSAGIRLGLRSFDFSLGSAQYQSSGPESCRGPFAIRDYFTEFVLGSILAEARPLIEEGVQLQVALLMPKIEAMLNEMTSQPMVLTTPNLFVVPPSQLAVTAKPLSLTLAPGSMNVKLGITVKPAEEEALVVSGMHVVPAGTVYGSLGVQQDLVNSILTATLAHGSTPVELTAAMNPMIAILTNRDELTAFWPDLIENPGAGDTLRVYARLVKAPVLTTLVDGSGWHVSVPDLELKYLVKKGGAWLDYAFMHVHGELDLAPIIDGGKLTMKILGGQSAATATWADGYSPVNPTFNESAANDAFNAVISLLSQSSEPMQFDLPTLSLVGRSLTLNNLHQQGEFSLIDLTEAP